MKHGNIRDLQDYADTIWTWDFLNDSFGSTGIRVSDADGMVERNSHLLLFETKKPNNEIPTGQLRMFKQLRLTGLVTVYVIWGAKNIPQKLQVFFPYPNYTIGPFSLRAAADLKSWVGSWFFYAENTAWEDAVTKAMKHERDAVVKALIERRKGN